MGGFRNWLNGKLSPLHSRLSFLLPFVSTGYGHSEAERAAKKKLVNYYRHNIIRYHWIADIDACEQCKRFQFGGPYSVRDALAGEAPIPGRDSHRGCRCTIILHID